MTGMNDVADLPAVGIDGALISWAWAGSSSGTNGGWVTSYDTKDVLAFQAAVLVVQDMSTRGFTLAHESYAMITRNESGTGARHYNGAIDLYFDRGRLGLKLPVHLDDVADTPRDMPMQQGRIARGRLIAPLAIVGGHGQKRAVEARARELVDLAQNVLHLVRPRPDAKEYRETRAVYVTYLTRSGKGGRYGRKVASRWFSLDEAAQFASLPTAAIEAHEEQPYDPSTVLDPLLGRLGR